MSYVIKNTSNGRFVADMRKSKDGSSFADKLQHAKVFPTRADARHDCCHNERVLTLEEAMSEP